MEKSSRCKVQEEPSVLFEAGSEAEVKVEEEEHSAIQFVNKKLPPKKPKNTSCGYRWSNTEQGRYIKFLQTNHHLFDLTINQRRSLKINRKMSQVVKGKDCLQCRSHHQKMMQKFGSVKGILQAYGKEKIFPESKQKIFQKDTRFPSERNDNIVKSQVKEEDERQPYKHTKIEQQQKILEVRPFLKHSIKILQGDELVDVKKEFLPELQKVYINYGRTL